MAKKSEAKPKRTKSNSPTLEESVGKIRQVRDELGGEPSIPELTTMLKELHDVADVHLEDRFEAERNEQHVACLKQSLQAAVTLEFATIPPYLTALWSIRDELCYAAKSIREVVQEEMLHMALACNMLASLGETPQIATTVPQYPSGLPGGVHKGLTVGLAGLTKETLAKFLWIERPIAQVPIDNPYGTETSDKFDFEKLKREHPNNKTIGEFYEEIEKAFEAYIQHPDNPRLTTENQVSGPLAWTVIRDMPSVKFAIELIQDQGEGAPDKPKSNRSRPKGKKVDLSHYYRFLEVYNEERYEWKSGKLTPVKNLPWPDVRDVAPIPPGGYQKAEVSEEVWHYLEKFDTTYSKLLDLLQKTWTVGGQAHLIRAYDVMFDLEWSAKPLMDTRLPFGGGATYGPCWRYKPNEQ